MTVHLILLDTSFQGALLGLARGEQSSWTLDTVSFYENPQEAATALPRMLQELMAKGGLSLEQIDGVVIGVGPGSFTGIKIGLSFAYGLKKACPRLELTGVSALRALSRHQAHGGLSVLPATATAGYFASRELDVRMLGIVRGPEVSSSKLSAGDATWELFEKTEQDSDRDSGRKPWPQSVNVIGVWPRLEEFLTARGIAFQNWPVTSLGEPLLQGMLADYVESSHSALDKQRLPQALYLRRSAPEEKLAPSSP